MKAIRDNFEHMYDRIDQREHEEALGPLLLQIMPSEETMFKTHPIVFPDGEIRVVSENDGEILVWLSFCDANLPEGSQFLGALVMRADDFMSAVALSHALGLNPGGEVRGIEFEAAKTTRPIPESHVHRLMTRAECERLDDYLINGTPL